LNQQHALDERLAAYIAGQAVIAVIEGLIVSTACVARTSDGRGIVDIEGPAQIAFGACRSKNRRVADAIIRAMVAGFAAETRISSGQAVAGDHRKPEEIRREAVFRAMGTDRNVPCDAARLFPRYWKEVSERVSTPPVWAAIMAVENFLLQGHSLSHGLIAAMVNRAISTGVLPPRFDSPPGQEPGR
jgi:hypothetical protein